jgi:hypothetical protein
MSASPDESYSVLAGPCRVNPLGTAGRDGRFTRRGGAMLGLRVYKPRCTAIPTSARKQRSCTEKNEKRTATIASVCGRLTCTMD